MEHHDAIFSHVQSMNFSFLWHTNGQCAKSEECRIVIQRNEKKCAYDRPLLD